MACIFANVICYSILGENVRNKSTSIPRPAIRSFPAEARLSLLSGEDPRHVNQIIKRIIAHYNTHPALHIPSAVVRVTRRHLEHTIAGNVLCSGVFVCQYNTYMYCNCEAHSIRATQQIQTDLLTSLLVVLTFF